MICQWTTSFPSRQMLTVTPLTAGNTVGLAGSVETWPLPVLFPPAQIGPTPAETRARAQLRRARFGLAVNDAAVCDVVST
jgi:hypothetical protein